MFLKNCPLCLKLILGFGCVLLFMVVLSVLTHFSLNGFNADMNDVVQCTALEKEMIRKEGDHLRFMAKAGSFFYDPKATRMEVQTDHRLCGLGKWLYGKDRKMAVNKFKELGGPLKKLEQNHEMLHATIIEINTLAEGKPKEQILDAAKNIFETKTQPALTEVRSDLSGIIDIFTDTAAKSKESFISSVGGSKRRNLILCTAAIVIGIASALFITRLVSNAINNIVEVNEELASGNMKVRSSIDQNDEMGQLATAANALATNIGNILKAVRGSSSTINASSNVLDQLSSKLAAAADEMASLCNATAAASEQMDANMTAIAAASEETSTNISMVAAAAEELTTTVTEIAENAENARVITSQAVDEAEQASTHISELDMAASKISKVTETINEIADQTNLLALNATIEAARAGEAGKGFAVVANEIKELAKQTTEATREIQQRIDGVQSSSTKTISAIGSITKIINESSEVVSGMAAAVEEQAVTTQEIAENVSQASVGMQEVNENIAQATVVNKDVTKDVSEIQQQAHGVASSSVDVRELATEMKSNADGLASVTEQFTIDEERFDIGAIKAAHFNWKMKLTAVLGGYQHMQSGDVPNHHQCDFGKWYDNAPEDLKALTLFKEMGKHHEDVHRKVMEAVDAHNQDRAADAAKKVEEFENARIELFQHLDKLYVSS